MDIKSIDKYENINLINFMQNVVDKYTEAYQTDFNYDKEILLDSRFECNEFIWYVRKLGTHLFRKNRVYFKEDSSNKSAFTWSNEVVKTYKIKVIKREEKSIYGNISEINVNEFLDDIKKNIKNYKGFYVKVELKKQLGKLHELYISKEENNTAYRTVNLIMEKLNIKSIEDIKRWNLIKYEEMP